MDDNTIPLIVLGGLVVIAGVIGFLSYRFKAYAKTKYGVTEDPVKDAVNRLINELTEAPKNAFFLLSVLMSDAIFLAGPIIDMINQSYQYTKASIIGLIATILTAILGSTKFADFSRNVIEYLPKIYTPFQGKPPVGVSWWSQFSIVGILVSLGIVISIFIPMMIGNFSSWAVQYTIAIATLFVFIELAGNGFLDVLTGPMQGPVQANPFSGGGIKADPDPSGYCDTPGFGWASNGIAPTSVVLSQTILWCHLIEMWSTGNNNFGSTLALSIGVFLAQYSALFSKGCLAAYGSGKLAPLVGLAISAGIAGYAYSVMKSTESFTSSSTSGGVFHPPPQQAPVKPKDGSKKVVVGEPGEQVSADLDSGEYDELVGELFKDGQPVSTVIGGVFDSGA